MARTSTYPLVDRALGGRLGTLLDQWHREGAKPAEMAYRLRADHGIKVSDSTVRRWLAAEQTEAAS